MLGHILSGGDKKQCTCSYYCNNIFSAMVVVNKAALYYFYLYYVLCIGGLAAMMCKWFVTISYVMNNNVNLPWIARAIVFRLSFDLGGRFGFVAAMLSHNCNRIGTRGCTTWFTQT